MLNKIQKISNVFLFIFNTILVIMPILVLLQWFCSDISFVQFYTRSFGFSNPTTDAGLDIASLPLLQRFLGFLGTLLSISSWLISIVLLRKIFKNYSRANIFCVANARYYQILGYIFFLDALITRPLSGAILSIASTLSNPPGQRVISIGITSINLQSLFCGMIIIVIARVMYLASQIEEDQKLVI